LAVLDEGGDGLAAAFQVGLWNSPELLLASAVVPAGDEAPLDGLWRLAAVEPLTLVPGKLYSLRAAPTGATADRFFFLNFDPGFRDPPMHDPSAVPFDPRVDVTQSSPSVSSDSGFHWPDQVYLVLGANLAPNVFLLPPIPEPNTALLLAIGLCGCGLLFRQKTSQVST
jgi:hypothetical protein